MNANEIIQYIANAEKKTPVKITIKERAPISYGSAKVFGVGDKVVFGDWKELGPILAENADHIEDMVIENDGQLHPLEIKRSVNPGSELTGAFSILDKGSVPRGTGAILCMRPELSAINAENYIVPVWMI